MTTYPIYLPPLPHNVGDGRRGWYRLAAVHALHDLPDIGNPYASGIVAVPDVVGGYALAAVTDDGDTLCERCVTDPANPIHPAPPFGPGDGWGVIGWTTSGEVDEPEWCAHCGREWTGMGEEEQA